MKLETHGSWPWEGCPRWKIIVGWVTFLLVPTFAAGVAAARVTIWLGGP